MPPDALRAEYTRFLRPGRILLSGHSHQAWPDAARDAQTRYFDDAAEHVDDKWDKAVFPLIERVGKRILGRMGYPETDSIVFGKSTHELAFRLLTCFSWKERPRIVTTTGEFHSLYRQLRRLGEEGVEIVWVDARERAGLADRLVAEIDERTKLVAVSAVFFEDAAVFDGLSRVVARAKAVGALPVVDAYHAFDVVPIEAPEDAFVLGGGYKYAQFGEGLCWLRMPRGARLRPVYTGWFADFGGLAHGRSDAATGYDESAWGFAGSTFDGSAAYRADAALDVFDRHGLTVPALREISLEQTSRILSWFEKSRLAAAGATLQTPRDPARRGGFVSIRTPSASRLVAALRARHVLTDSRGDLFRLGPAPYLLDTEIDAGLAAVDAAVHDLGAGVS